MYESMAKAHPHLQLNMLHEVLIKDTNKLLKYERAQVITVETKTWVHALYLTSVCMQ